MNQSNPDFEIPEMPLPPQPPLEEDPTPTSAIEWPALQEFDSHLEAFEWAYYQNKAGGPRYKVQSLRNGSWEAIQAWMCNY